MPTKDEIAQLAVQEHTRFQERASELKRQLRELETHKAQIESQLQETNLALDRLASFEPERGGDLQCPGCWIAQGVHSPLIPMPGTKGASIFRCASCHFERIFPS